MVGTWKLLKSVAVGSGGADSIDTGELGSYDFLKVSVYLIPSGGNIHGYMYFNGDGTSTGNYARRGCSNGGSGSSSGDFEVSPDNEINFTNQVNETCSAFFAIANPNSSTGKQITGWEQEDGGSSAPNRFEWSYKYITTGRITSIQVKNNLSSSSNFAEHSYITVWGSSSDTVTDEKTTLTSVPENTQYRETDTRKIYRAAVVPDLDDDFSSSTGWTQVGSWVQISGGKVVFSGGSNANNNVNRAIGTTLSNTKWVLRFKYNSKVNDFGNMVLSSGTAHPDSDNTDWIGFYAGSATNNGYALSWGDSGAMSTASWIGTSSVSANTDYWVQITRESGTSAKLEMFDNSEYSGTPVGTSSTTSLPSSITGISNIILASITEGGASSGYSWEIDDLKIYNNTTTATPSKVVWTERGTA